MQKILVQLNNNKEEFQKYLDELFKGDFSLISQLDYSFILKIIFLMDELELFENFKLVSYLSLDNQYKLLKEPLKEKTLIIIIPYLDARVKSFFFKNDKRAYEIFQYYIISEYGADVLEQYTDEIVYYNEQLDLYLWGIDHFGTSWDYVLTNIVVDKDSPGIYIEEE